VSSNGSGSHLATPTSIPGQVPSLPGTPGEIERARLVAVVEEGMAQAHTQQRELLRMQERLLTGQLELARALLEQGANMNAAAPLGAVLEAVQRQQAAAVQQHEGFIAHQAGYAEGLLGALTQLATTLLGATDAPRSAPEAADVGSIRAAARLPLPLAPLASSVEPPLASAAGASLASAVEAPPTYPAPPVQADVTISPALSSLPPASGFPPAPEIPVLPAAATTLTELQSAMLEVVSEKTGYPVATLELDMDIEADLGIDSIKRVEILGAMQARFTDLPEVKPEQLGALRTLQEVVDYLRREKTAPEHSGLGAGGADEAVVLAVPRLRTIPAPDRLEAGLPPGHCVLLTDDGSALVGSIASELSARGETTVVLRLPASLVPDPLALPAEVAELVLDGVAETEIEQALREVMRRHGPIGTFIHLHPRAEPPGFLDETQDELLRAVFLVATHLRASLTQSATLGRGSFVVVTRLDGALGTGRGESDPAGGGLYGLAKTVRHEWPAVFCRAIDLAPSLDLDAAVAAVLAELADPDERILEVAYGPDGRQTPAAEWLSAWRG
jgi:acyl carrier protein